MANFYSNAIPNAIDDLAEYIIQNLPKGKFEIVISHGYWENDDFKNAVILSPRIGDMLSGGGGVNQPDLDIEVKITMNYELGDNFTHLKESLYVVDTLLTKKVFPNYTITDIADFRMFTHQTGKGSVMQFDVSGTANTKRRQ